MTVRISEAFNHTGKEGKRGMVRPFLESGLRWWINGKLLDGQSDVRTRSKEAWGSGCGDRRQLLGGNLPQRTVGQCL